MKSTLNFLLLTFLLSNCATIFHKKHYTARISSNLDSAQVEVYGKTYPLPAKVKLRRSNKPLAIRLFDHKDYNQATFVAPRGTTINYLNVFTPGFLGFGIDAISKQHCKYGHHIFLEADSTTNQLTYKLRKVKLKKLIKDNRSQKGQFKLLLGSPYFQWFSFQPEGEPLKQNSGFFGLATGLEYFYQDNLSLSLEAGTVFDFETPFLLTDLLGEQERLSSIYGYLKHNHQVGRFSLGYGLSYAFNEWQYSYRPLLPGLGSSNPPRGVTEITQRHHTLGTVFDVYYQTGAYFHIGLMYRPTFLKIQPETQWVPEHVLSLKLQWKINLN